MARSAVGIYISSRYVDLVEIEGSASAPRLLNAIRQEITQPALPQQGEATQKQLPSQENLVAAIKGCLAKLTTRPKGIYTTLPIRDAMIRHFDMPSIPKSEQQQAVRFESKKYVPFKLEEVVSDFKALAPSKKNAPLDIFFVATTKHQLNAHIDLFKKAGTDTLGVDIIPFALMRIILLAKKTTSKENISILYIDSDKKSASVHIMERGMPFLSRDIAINTDDKDALFEKLASELRVSIDYYHRHKPQAEIAKIIICGEYLYADLEAFIANELKVITETLSRIAAVRGLDKAPFSSIIPLGVSLEGLGRTPYSVNLSPLAAVIQKRKVVNKIIAESILVALIISAVFMYSLMREKASLAELNRIKDQGKELPAYTSMLDINALNNLKKKQYEELDFLQLLINKRISWAEKLSRAAHGLPEGVWIDNLMTEESFIQKGGSLYPTKIAGRITISGGSFSPDSSAETGYVNNYFKFLKEDKIFMSGLDNIELDSMSKNMEANNYWVTRFDISAYSREQASGKRQ